VNNLARLYQQFDPIRPLEADGSDDDLYVDWQKVLAPDNLKRYWQTRSCARTHRLLSSSPATGAPAKRLS
jgi:hypothetical protein